VDLLLSHKQLIDRRLFKSGIADGPSRPDYLLVRPFADRTLADLSLEAGQVLEFARLVVRVLPRRDREFRGDAVITSGLWSNALDKRAHLIKDCHPSILTTPSGRRHAPRPDLALRLLIRQQGADALPGAAT